MTEPIAAPQDTQDTHDARGPRQLVLISDGTNMNFSGGVQDSNAVKLLEWLTANPDPQRLVCYDPGVGHPKTLHSVTWWDHLADRWERMAGLAFGMGVQENVVELYGWLVARWQPGDQIFLFGFSRGAFTVRSVGGLVNRYGVVRPEHREMVPTLVSAYFSEQPEPTGLRAADLDELERRARGGGALACQFSKLLADPAARSVPVHFVGVWDTVASIGLPPFRASFSAGKELEHKAFINVRHALALHEYRLMFAHRAYHVSGSDATEAAFPVRRGLTATRHGTVKQCWFPGDHRDVGGGRPHDDAGLSRTPCAWMLEGAAAAGLRVPAPQAAYQPSGAAAPLPNTTLAEAPWWALTGLQVRGGWPCENQLAARGPPINWAGTGALKVLTMVIFAVSLLVTVWLGSIDGRAQSLAPLIDWLRWSHGLLGPSSFLAPPPGDASGLTFVWAFLTQIGVLTALSYPVAWAFVVMVPGCFGAGRGTLRRWLNRLGLALPLCVLGALAFLACGLARSLAVRLWAGLPATVETWTPDGAAASLVWVLAVLACLVNWMALAISVAGSLGVLVLLAGGVAVSIGRRRQIDA